MRGVLAVVVIGLCYGCADPGSRSTGALREQDSTTTKEEAIGTLVASSDVVVLGKITGIRDGTARDAGIVYDVVLKSVLYGTDVPAEVLRFRSAGWTGYARYQMDEEVLLFLQRRNGEFVQATPVCYISGKPTPGALDLRPLTQYRSEVEEAIQNREDR